MVDREVEVLAVGAGPSNLALAVALEELAPDLARSTLVIEREADVAWQRGMLLPEVSSNTSFIKDLVTLRNPRSRFSFLNYLHATGRLDEFVNMGSLTPFRVEVDSYLKWTAASLALATVQTGTEIVSVTPQWTGPAITGWVARTTAGQVIRSRYLAIGVGRDPRIPEALAGLPRARVIHSTQYRQRISALPRDIPYRVTVIGAGQSAGELFAAVQDDLPECRPTLVTRSIGFNNYETSKFNNELYYPGYVDEFHETEPEARRQILSEMHHTNYAGLSTALMDNLYRQFYLDRLSGRSRLQMLTLHDIARARDDGNEIIFDLTDRRTGTSRQHRADLVLLGTGFSPRMPGLVRGLAAEIGLTDVSVTRNYRLITGRPDTAACYLHGVNESTHGIADTLLALLASRASDILTDILTNHHHATPPAPVSAPLAAS